MLEIVKHLEETTSTMESPTGKWYSRDEINSYSLLDLVSLYKVRQYHDTEEDRDSRRWNE